MIFLSHIFLSLFLSLSLPLPSSLSLKINKISSGENLKNNNNKYVMRRRNQCVSLGSRTRMLSVQATRSHIELPGEMGSLSVALEVSFIKKFKNN